MPSFQLSRSITIDADAQQVYELLSDYRTWTTWSPWLLADPEAKVTVSDDSASEGSKYHWQGTVTGEGQIVHKRLESGRLIQDDLTFLKPFKSCAKASFHLRSRQSTTEVTWSMDSSMPWFLFWLIPMIKTSVAMDYQRGLNMIKDLVETGSIPSKTTVHGIEPIQTFKMAGVAASSPVDQIGPALEKSFAEAQTALQQAGLPRNGQMISVYTKFDVKRGIFHYISGYMIPNQAAIPSGSALTTWSPTTSKAFHVEHTGSYRHLGNGWSVANQIARHQKLKLCRTGAYEIYRTTPPETPEAELATDIYLPMAR